MKRLDFYKTYEECKLRRAKHLFSDILIQHSIVMVDTAVPDLVKHDYVKLGVRLGNVQQDWVNLLCSGIKEDSDLDVRYRKVVTNTVVNFTDKLMEMMDGNKVIPFAELKQTAEVHATLSSAKEHALRKTAELLMCYVRALSQLYQTRTEEEYKGAAYNCLSISDALGNWLDMTIFEK